MKLLFELFSFIKIVLDKNTLFNFWRLRQQHPFWLDPEKDSEQGQVQMVEVAFQVEVAWALHQVVVVGGAYLDNKFNTMTAFFHIKPNDSYYDLSSFISKEIKCICQGQLR